MPIFEEITVSPHILLEKDLQDPRFHILQQKNKGGGAARNLGISVAKGDYLLFLDSDDFFKETFIEKMHAAAVETSADMVVCQYKRYNTSTKKISETISINPRFVSRNEIRTYNHPPSKNIDGLMLFPWNKLCSRRFIQENELYFQETMHHNDNYFSITATISAQKIAIISDPLIYYRVGMKTNTQATNYKHPFDIFEVTSAVYQYLVTTNQFHDFEISYYEYMINSFSGQLLKLKKYDCYKEVYLRVLQNIKSHSMSNFSLRKCDNKLTYMKYLKLIEYPESKYINESIGDCVLFLLRHPPLTLSIGIYLLKNTRWSLTTYGIKNVLYHIMRIIGL